jgi:hypothetical protein
MSMMETSCACGPDIAGKDSTSICAYIDTGRELLFTQEEYQLLR